MAHQDFFFKTKTKILVVLYLLFNISVIPQKQQMGQGKVEAEMKTGCVVDLGVPATQEKGEDGQSKEEKSKNHTHSIQPVYERILWWRLRKQQRQTYRLETHVMSFFKWMLP